MDGRIITFGLIALLSLGLPGCNRKEARVARYMDDIRYLATDEAPPHPPVSREEFQTFNLETDRLPDGVMLVGETVIVNSDSSHKVLGTMQYWGIKSGGVLSVDKNALLEAYAEYARKVGGNALVYRGCSNESMDCDATAIYLSKGAPGKSAVDDKPVIPPFGAAAPPVVIAQRPEIPTDEELDADRKSTPEGGTPANKALLEAIKHVRATRAPNEVLARKQLVREFLKSRLYMRIPLNYGLVTTIVAYVDETSAYVGPGVGEVQEYLPRSVLGDAVKGRAP